MRTAVTVEGKDIKNIGHTHYSENGMLNIICDGDTYGIEGILLRSILSCINPEYKIVKEGDFWYGSGECDYEFKTNVPFAEYERISREG
jgi:hypothetical protein